MSELPVSWTEIPLGNLATFEMGQAPPGSASNFNGNGTPFVKAGEFGHKRPVIREWTTAPKKFAKETDVLICVVGATAGKLNLGANCAIGRSVAAIRPTASVNQLMLYYQLLARVVEMRASTTGTAQGVISKDMLADLPVALPPLIEQKRIADKLEAILGRVDDCRARLDRVPALIKRFRQSVLAAATSGTLTEEWRTPRKVAPWSERPLGSLCENGRIITYGVIKLGLETPKGVPCLRTSNVRWLGLIQAALIAGLLFNRAQRRRGEEATALIADISSRFVNIPASDVDREIHDAQHRICKLLDIDASVLWQWDDLVQGLFTATHIHSLTGGPQPPMQIEADNFPWVRQEILSGRAVVLRSLDELPDEASKDRETALRSGASDSGSPPCRPLPKNSPANLPVTENWIIHFRPEMAFQSR